MVTVEQQHLPSPRTPSGVAIVTGAGSGIGAASALALAADGWRVVLAGRRRAALEVVARRGAGLPGVLQPVPTDVTDEESVGKLFAAVTAEHGRIDLLFNNAGMFPQPSDPDAITFDEWNAVVSVNITGTFLCTRAAFAVMRRQQPQGGRIINNGSVSAHSPRPGSLPYTVSKHAVNGLTKSTSLDGRAHNIACGQIDIGNAATDLAAFDAGMAQPDGSVRPEPSIDVANVADAVVFMARLPLNANVHTMTIMASAMPLIGRG